MTGAVKSIDLLSLPADSVFLEFPSRAAFELSSPPLIDGSPPEEGRGEDDEGKESSRTSRDVMGTNSINKKSRHDEERKRAEGSEALKGGRGVSKDIFFILLLFLDWNFGG